MKLNEMIQEEQPKCMICGKEFDESMIFFGNHKAKMFFCKECVESNRIETGSRYVMFEDEAVQLWDNNMFEKLRNGVYELKLDEKGMLMLSCTEKSSAAFFSQCCSSGHFILEKIYRNAVLIFPEVMQKRTFEFLSGDHVFSELVTNVINDFKVYTECDDYCVVINDITDTVIGISNIGGRRSKFNEFSVCRTGYSSVSLKEFKEECVTKAFDKFVSAAMKRLTPKMMLEYCEKRIMGQGNELKKAVYMVYRYMKSIADGDFKAAENWLLTAPSGSGKTEFFRAVRDMFEEYDVPIPVVQIDLSRITEEGYKGENASEIPKYILRENTKLDGIGICFLDEADKKCVPSYSRHNINTNAAIQSNLLTLTEGAKLKVEIDGTNYNYNSEKTMFILMGAFQDVRNQKRDNESAGPSLGFNADFSKKDTSDEAEEAFYKGLELQDIIDYGMLEELAGRMTQIINFKRLSHEDMGRLIKCKAASISEELGFEIELTKQAEQELLDVSFGSMGVRRPINIIKSLAQNAVAEVFFERGFDCGSDKVVITSVKDAVVENKCSAALNERGDNIEKMYILCQRQAVG